MEEEGAVEAHQSKTPACSSYIPLVTARPQHSSGSARRCIRSPAGPRMRGLRRVPPLVSLASPPSQLELVGSSGTIKELLEET